ncbi:MAG TPA: hypothetical protein VFS00_03520, partial [Polyangiaceae bacterium]|nr:hypothetical protein [Polyangiaceae bacterium]
AHPAAPGASPYPGTMSPEGDVVVPGVPEGPYLLELARPSTTPGGAPFREFYEFTERDIDLSHLYSHRADVQAMTQPTYVTINAPLTRPWQAGASDEQLGPAIALDDMLYAYSRNAFVVGIAQGGEGAYPEPAPGDGTPANGAAALAWRLDLDAMVESLYGPSGDAKHLVDAGKGDDFMLLHMVAKPVRTPGPPPAGGGDDPWAAYSYTSLEAALSAAPFTLTDGGAATIDGAFAAVPQKAFALDYKGSAFNALLADAPAAPLIGVDLSFVVYHEPGAPEPADGAFADLINVYVRSRPAYVDKLCNPDNEDDEGEEICADTTACPAGCNDQKALALPGDHAREYAYGNPLEGGQEVASFVYQFRSRFGDSVTSSASTNQLRGGFYVLGPAAEFNGAPLVPVVGLARNVTLNGQPAPAGALTAGVGLTPTVSFEPPSFGTPTSYRVRVNKIRIDRSNPDNEVASAGAVAAIELRGTTVTLPAGLLEAGSSYYVQVEANVREPSPSGSPFRRGPHTASSTTFTGVFTP